MTIRYVGHRHSHIHTVVTSTSFWIIWVWVPWKGSPSTSMPTTPDTPLRTLCRTRMPNIFSSWKKMRAETEVVEGGGGKRKRRRHLQGEEELWTWCGLFLKNKISLNHTDATERLIMKIRCPTSRPNCPKPLLGSSHLEESRVFFWDLQSCN